MHTAKYNYEIPPVLSWNEVELKIELVKISKMFGLTGDIDIDSGHSFSYSVSVFFPQKYQEYVIMNKFIAYDAHPEVIKLQEMAIESV
jgi:hypothetical protein